MISTSPKELADWSDDGETFVVKNPDEFAKQIIPQYFKHSNFSSFKRQLNFYGFKKVPIKAVRTSEYDKESSKHVRFYNEKFKRGRKDLLCQIQRSTRNGNNANNQNQEIKTLKDRVAMLEDEVYRMGQAYMNLESQMNQMLANMGSFGPDPTQSGDTAKSYNRMSSGASNFGKSVYANASPNDVGSYQMNGYNPMQQLNSSIKDKKPTLAGFGTNASSSHQQQRTQSPEKSAGSSGNRNGGTATLAPHPNVKEMDPSLLPPAPPDATQLRAASLLRGFSSEYSPMFTSYEEKLFENIIRDPPNGTPNNTDVNLVANEQSNIKSMEGLNISRQQTCTDVLPPVDADVGSSTAI